MCMPGWLVCIIFFTVGTWFGVAIMCMVSATKWEDDSRPPESKEA